MSDPLLDFRTVEDFYQQALALARTYTPQWSADWPPVLQQPLTSQDPVAASQAVNLDPGLVLLNLFAQLAGYTAVVENQIPYQRRQSFFRFLSLVARAPLPAVAPLQFTLKDGQAARRVPAQTAVLDAGAQTIRFQTSEELLVVPARLSAAMTLVPSQDQYIDAMPELTSAMDGSADPPGVSLFVAGDTPDAAEAPLGHWFMIGDAQLFKPDPALQGLTITLFGSQLYREYFGQWFDAGLHPLSVQLSASPDARRLDITFDDKPGAPPATIDALVQRIYTAEDAGAGFSPPGAAASDQAPEYWLVVKPAPQVKVLASLEQQLPVVTGLQCTFRGGGIQAQQAAFNVVLLDIANGAYPFGETPQTSDAFYVRNDVVFARTGARVSLTFDLVPVGAQYPVTLYWQFWSGSNWQSFNETLAQVSEYQFVDTTHNLQYNAPAGPTRIQFECPAMTETSVAGSKGLWIRALIASGGYGEAGGFVTTGVADTIDGIPDAILPPERKASVIAYLNDVEGVNFSYHFNEARFYPPYIRSLQTGYSYVAQPTRYLTYNAFELSRFLFSPYKPVDEVLTGFYFAFATDGFGAQAPGNRFNLYIYLEAERAAPGSKLQWQYHDGAAWRPLAVDDSTYGLSRSGIVAFVVPVAMQPATLYSQRAYWFRVNNPHVSRTIRVYGIFPNAVMARNVTGVDDEVLGSSNEQPGQVFQLTYTPVLPEVDLQVIEPDGLDHAPPADDASGTQTAADDATGRPGRAWRQVDTFSLCGPTDRVYTLDCQNGLITFGDGYNGMIPPAGYNNIVAAHYEHTQGLAGNVARNTLTLLRPGISGIDTVTNPAAALGGVNGDTPADIAATGPRLVKTNGYAVELGDLATLAARASQQVAQARAIEMPDRTVRIALLALSDAPVPYTTPAMLDTVAAAVRAGCLAPLAPRIGTVAPEFVPIDVTAQLSAACAPDQRNALQQSIEAQLAAFFQPVFGGPARTGWRFGQTVQWMTLSRFLRQLPQVSAVRALSLNGRSNGDVTLAPGQLPVAGRMSALVYLE
jgi:hypothetical protein